MINYTKYANRSITTSNGYDALIEKFAFCDDDDDFCLIILVW